MGRRPNREGCDDGDEFPQLKGGTNDVRLSPGERLLPASITVVKVENGWLLTVILDDGRKMRHVASTALEAGQTLRGLLTRADYDWIPSFE